MGVNIANKIKPNKSLDNHINCTFDGNQKSIFLIHSIYIYIISKEEIKSDILNSNDKFSLYNYWRYKCHSKTNYSMHII